MANFYRIITEDTEVNSRTKPEAMVLFHRAIEQLNHASPVRLVINGWVSEEFLPGKGICPVWRSETRQDS